MCLILDTNRYSDFVNPANEDMKPVKKWIESKGKIAYSPTKKFEEELNKITDMRKSFDRYKKAGRIKLVDKKKVEQKTKELKDSKVLKSDDPHIIALAQIANITLLVSSDKKLGEDFRNSKIIKKGSIYKNRAHSKLLENFSCN